MIKTIVVAAMFIVPTALLAQQQPVTGTAAAKTVKPHKPGDTIVCREDDELGSHIMKKKICMTADQWRAQSSELGGAMNQRTPGN